MSDSINVGGKRVRVGNEFWALSREQQNATVDEIAAQLGIAGNIQKSGDDQGRATRAQRESMQAPVSMMEAIGTGIKQGATFNLSDEVQGLKAAGTPDALTATEKPYRMGLIGSGLAMAGGGVKMLAEKAAPSYFGNSATKAYDDRVAAERAELDRVREQRPNSMLAGEVLGSLATPVPLAAEVMAARAAGQTGRALASASAGGAAIGAASGFGSGNGLSGSVDGALVGGLVGAPVGAASVPLAAAGGKAIEAVRNAASRVRGTWNPEAEAMRRVQAHFAKDAQAGNVMSGEQFASSVQNGQPIIAADIGGESTRALMRSATDTSPVGREKISSAIADRFEGQSERMTTFLETLGNTNVAATKESLQAQAKVPNKTAYDRAYKEGSGGVWNDALAEIASTPLGQQAMKDAMTMAKNRAPLDGFAPPPNPFVAGADGVMALKPGATPTIQFWDHVQRSLREAADKGDNTAKQLRGMLNAELDKAVPSFNEARLGAAKFFGAQDALEAGYKFAMPGKMNYGEAMQAMRKFSPQDKALFDQGYLGGLVDRIGKLGDGRDIVKNVLNSQDARQRAMMTLGPDRLQKVEAFLESEALMNATRAALGSSKTAQFLHEAGMAGGGSVAGYAYGGDTQSAAAGAVLQKALRSGNQKIDSRVVEKVADILASNDPKAWAKITELASKNKDVMKAISGATRYLTQMTASRASEIPHPAIIGLPRATAEDSQSK